MMKTNEIFFLPQRICKYKFISFKLLYHQLLRIKINCHIIENLCNKHHIVNVSLISYLEYSLIINKDNQKLTTIMENQR